MVLIVDDDESIREALGMALEMEGCPAEAAANGEQALTWLRHHELPDLILLDLMMPVMNGWQLLEKLSADSRLASVPVVVVTAFKSDLGSAGRLPVLSKPVDLDDLLVAVRTHSRKEA